MQASWLHNRDHLTLLISLLALLVSSGSMLFVGIQIWLYLKQLRFDSTTRILEINRQLILAGFEHPDLFDVLEGKEIADDRRKIRYLQLWLNQAHLVWLANRDGLVIAENWDGYKEDFRYMARLPTFASHWSKVRSYYAFPFVCFVESFFEHPDPAKNRENQEDESKPKVI